MPNSSTARGRIVDIGQQAPSALSGPASGPAHQHPGHRRPPHSRSLPAAVAASRVFLPITGRGTRHTPRLVVGEKERNNQLGTGGGVVVRSGLRFNLLPLLVDFRGNCFTLSDLTCCPCD
ncbi:hypothetical protein NDU88_000789 [Pleurodeles waltl]|uniref:Uncharacterized protein n=1 Tax=Pleurodeles waltl TaxID=8319 RepID=A0AAV7TGI6_PLEWA|nr:hypothetical protein NDU88_000789 [Pleurodeles waltl]